MLSFVRTARIGPMHRAYSRNLSAPTSKEGMAIARWTAQDPSTAKLPSANFKSIGLQCGDAFCGDIPQRRRERGPSAHRIFEDAVGNVRSGHDECNKVVQKGSFYGRGEVVLLKEGTRAHLRRLNEELQVFIEVTKAAFLLASPRAELENDRPLATEEVPALGGTFGGTESKSLRERSA